MSVYVKYLMYQYECAKYELNNQNSINLLILTCKNISFINTIYYNQNAHVTLNIGVKKKSVGNTPYFHRVAVSRGQMRLKQHDSFFADK